MTRYFQLDSDPRCARSRRNPAQSFLSINGELPARRQPPLRCEPSGQFRPWGEFGAAVASPLRQHRGVEPFPLPVVFGERDSESAELGDGPAVELAGLEKAALL